MIRPLYNNVLLKKEKVAKTTLSGIILTQKEEDEEFAIVAAVSGCKEVKVNDHIYEMSLKVGDKVMYREFAGTKIKDGEEDYILIKAEDILAIVEE